MSYTRRSFFAAFGRSMLSELARVVDTIGDVTSRDAAPNSTEPLPRWLRPPGALPESAFLQACTKCTACQEVCPYQSIRRLGPGFGETGGTPVIIPEESPCYLCSDMPCIAACEPRALQRVSPAEVAMGTAVIQRDACYVGQGQPCDYCVTRCPLKSEAIAFNHDGLPQVNEGGCTGCGVCAYLCPPQAIRIRTPEARRRANSE